MVYDGNIRVELVFWSEKGVRIRLVFCSCPGVLEKLDDALPTHGYIVYIYRAKHIYPSIHLTYLTPLCPLLLSCCLLKEFPSVLDPPHLCLLTHPHPHHLLCLPNLINPLMQLVQIELLFKPNKQANKRGKAG